AAGAARHGCGGACRPRLELGVRRQRPGAGAGARRRGRARRGAGGAHGRRRRARGASARGRGGLTVAHGVLVALTGDLEQEVVAAVDRTADLVVVRRCADVAELAGAALAGLGSVAVVAAAHEPDRPLVARLAQVGTATIVVCGAADRDRYTAMGATAVVDDAGAAPVMEAVAAAAPVLPPVPPEPAAEAAPAVESPPGRLVTVGGAHGAPGRTTVAINLAAEIAAAGARVLLVDADVWGAAVATSLGLLEESAGLAAAVRAADQGTLEPASLLRLCARVNDRMLVLPGLPRSSRWREVSGAGIDALWEPARRLADWVVVETGTWVPDDERTVGLDAVLGPRRNAVTASATAAADAMVTVGAAEPVAVQRLVQTLLDLEG